ncbi:MAG: hypothetical protein K1Y36_23790 [Blastocatellia bacterium]|nr:hypothetical protein [Blastocatellia bacterium]
MYCIAIRKVMLVLTVVVLSTGLASAQNSPSGKPAQGGRQTQSTQRPAGNSGSNPYGADSYHEESKPAPSIANDEKIVLQLQELVKAVNALREQNQAQTAVSLLQVQQNRLTAVEAKLTAARSVVTLIKEKQLANSRRNDNIRNEVIGRGLLNQSEGEQVVRADIEAENIRLQGERNEAEQQLAAIQLEYDQVKAEIEQTKQQVMQFLTTKPASDQQ